MLDPWIIEEIRRREEAERSHRERPVVHIETPQLPAHDQGSSSGERPQQGPHHGEERGVVIIDFSIG